MAFLAPAFTAIGGASSALSVASSVVGAFSAVASAMYQSKVASNNAIIANNNANRAVQEAAVAAQEQDFAARGEIGDIISQAGASGLTLDTGTQGLRRRSASELAARDRGYTIYRGATEAAAYRQQGADFKAEASAAKSKAFFGLAGGAIDVGSSLVSGATKVNNATARRIGTTRIAR